MIGREKQLDILRTITKDPLFAKSQKYQSLLKYLVECSLDNTIPHEKDIAINVLGKDDSFDPYEDTLVRVHIYKLRKKLQTYYETTGQNDHIILSIPKGHYHVAFTNASREEEKRSSPPQKIKWLIPIALTLILIILAQTIYIVQHREKLPASSGMFDKNFLWSGLTDESFPLMLALGNLFAFTEHQQELNSFRLVRDERIQSASDLENFVNENNLDPQNYTIPTWEIVPKSGLVNVLTLQPLLSSINQNIEFRTTDEIEWKDLNEYNIIYIGHFHNLKLLSNVHHSIHFQETTEKNELHYRRKIRVQESGFDTTYQFIDPITETGQYTKDYVLLSRIPGPSGNELLFIISFLHIGRTEVIRTLVDKKAIKDLEKQIKSELGQLPQYFEMLIEVEGFERTALKTSLLHVYELPNDFQIRNTAKE